jgi:SAM-dependent methyltransferase
MTEGGFEDRYRTGDTPWDHGTVDHNLTEMLERYAIRPCRVLDVGCGTGENAIWLGQQGFDVVACDLSDTAIHKAEEKRLLRGSGVRFVVADFIADDLPEGPYGLIVDRGCLHCMESEADRAAFIRKVASLLDQEGCWFSLIGNADEGEREVGPPQLTAAEVVSAVEPYFRILSLSSGFFGSDQDDPPQAWILMMQKRPV